MTEFLLLVSSDHGTGETTVSVPTAGLRSRVSTGHPTQELPVVDDEVGERELMGVEHERRDTKRKDGQPEVDQVGSPYGDGRVEQEEQITHAHVDTRPSESGVKDREGYTRCRETTAGGDVASTTIAQIVQDGLGVDLGGEDFEDRRERQEMFP